MGENNLKNRKVIYLVILIIGLFAISSVSASEFDDNLGITDTLYDEGNFDTITYYNAVDEEKNSNDIISENHLDQNLENDEKDNEKGYDDFLTSEITLNGGTCDDIQRMINNSKNGDIIKLNGDYSSSNLTFLNISKSITISGEGDAYIYKPSNLESNDYFYMVLINSNVILENIKFSGMSNFEVHLNNSQLTIRNCTFLNIKNCDLNDIYALYSPPASMIIVDSFFDIQQFLYIRNSSISNCTFNQFGSTGFSLESSYTTLFNSTFNNCSIQAMNSTFKNSDFNNASIQFNRYYELISCENCNFYNMGRRAIDHTGNFKGYLINCSFINPTEGITVTFRGEIYNCSFLNCNNIYIYNKSLIYNSNFIETAVGVIGNDSLITNCNFTDCYSEYTSYSSAIYSNNSNFVVVNCIINNSVSTIIPQIENLSTFFGNNILINATFLDNRTLKFKFLENAYVLFKINNVYYPVLTDEYGEGSLELNLDFDPGIYEIEYYNVFTGEIKKNILEIKSTIISNNAEFELGENSFKAVFLDNNGNLLKNKEVYFLINNVSYSVLTDENGVATYNFNLDPNRYNLTLFNPFSNESKNNQIVIHKVSTILTSSSISTIYQVGKNLVVTLKDSKGNILVNKRVSINVGSISKTLSTNSKGQVSVDISILVPKTYIASISFEGDSIYLKSLTNVDVVVKKATPKLTAKAKTFKISVKTKQYSITLKNNKGVIMKNTKVTLTVNKKTYSVKTNSKGVATFKITNLNKKGKFTAVVKYAGSKYYNKVTKKSIITIKS